jgi:hypothetical protein
MSKPHPLRTLAIGAAAAAALVLLALPLSSRAADTSQKVPWSQGFRFASAGGFVNPAVLVGFNPQPEPPVQLTELMFDDSKNPVLVLHDQHNPAGGFLLFDVFVGAGVPGVPLSFSAPFVDPKSQAPETVSTTALSPGGDVLLNFYFDIYSSSGGLVVPGTLVAFNPQPEPPAGFGSGAFGMSFGISSLSDAMVRLRVIEGSGTPLLLSPVPEPRGMMAVGMLALMALVWRRQRQRPNRG